MKILNTLPGGGQIALIPLSDLICVPEYQRKGRPKQRKRFRDAGGLDWQFLGLLFVIDGNQISRTYRGKWHVAEGNNRRLMLLEEFPDGFYPIGHPSIPKGFKAGDKVMVSCYIMDRDPIEAFEKLNDCDRVKDIQKFSVRLNSDDVRYSPERQICKLFEDAGVTVKKEPCKTTRDNETSGAHKLLPLYATNPQSVRDTIKIVTTVYRSPKRSGVVESVALTYAFMLGVCKAIISGLEYRDVMDALEDAKYGDDELTAQGIRYECQGSGGGPTISNICRYIIRLTEDFLEAREKHSEKRSR